MRCGGADVCLRGLSWESLSVVELGFGGGGAGTRICGWVCRLELLAEKEVGFVRGCRAGLRWRAWSRDSFAGAVMGFVGGLRAGYFWQARR